MKKIIGLLFLSIAFSLFGEQLCLTGNSRGIPDAKTGFEYHLYTATNTPVNALRLFPDPSGEHPNKLFDGNTETSCVFYGGLNRAEVIVIDFRHNYVLNSVKITLPVQNFKQLEFFTKDDTEGIWRDIATVAVNKNTKDTLTVPLKDTTARYLKIKYVAVDKKRPLIKEIQVFGSRLSAAEQIQSASSRPELHGKTIDAMLIVHPANYCNDKLYMAQGVPAHVIFFGRKTEAIRSPQIVLEVPEDYRISPQTGVSIVKDETFKFKNTSYKRLTLSSLDKFGKQTQTVFIELPSGRQVQPDDYMFYYITSPDGMNEKNAIKLINCGKFSPPALPKSFFIGFYDDFRLMGPPDDIFSKLLKIDSELGIRGGGKRGWNKQMVDKGWLTIPFWPFFAYRLQDSYPNPPSELNCINRKGKKIPGTFCPTYIAEGNNIFSEKFRENVTLYMKNPDGTLANYALIDFEPFHEECFCPRCIKSFCEKYKLTGKLDAAKILSDHAAAWLEFRYWQNGQAVRRLRQEITAINPSMQFICCSNYVKDAAEKKLDSSVNAVDPKYWQEWTDINMPMIYQRGTVFFDACSRTIKQLSKPTWPITAIYEYMLSGKGYTTTEVKMNILAAAALGAPCVFLYQGQCNFDGNIYLMLAEVMNYISKAEDYYLKGNNATNFTVKAQNIRYQKDIRYTAGTLNGKTLVSVFNYNPEHSVAVTVRAADVNGAIQIKNLYNDKYLRIGNKVHISAQDLQKGITLKIERQGFMPLLIEPATSTAFNNCYDVSVNDGGGKNRKAFQAVDKNGIKISASGSADSNDLVLTVKTPAQVVGINCSCGGIISSWQPTGAETELILQKSPLGAKQSGAAVDLFWFPNNAAWSGEEALEYTVAAAGVNADSSKAVISLKRKLHWGVLSGIIINKKIIIDAASTTISLEYTFRNSAAEPVKMGFWVHNVFTVGSKSNTELCFIHKDKDGSMIRESGNTPIFIKGKDIIASNFIGIENKRTNHVVSTNISGALLKSIFCWRDIKIIPTLEWQYNAVTLQPNAEWKTDFILKYADR